jgi:hypothetical protein
LTVAATLRHFLAVLATDLEKFMEYQQNPEEVMAEAGLSDADKAALRSGDAQVLEAQICPGSPIKPVEWYVVLPAQPGVLLPPKSYPPSTPVPGVPAVCVVIYPAVVPVPDVLGAPAPPAFGVPPQQSGPKQPAQQRAPKSSKSSDATKRGGTPPK